MRRAAALCALLACTAAAPSGEPVTIDAIVSLTGQSAFAGAIHATALRMYENAANASGGIRGRPVHFEIHDDQSSSVIGSSPRPWGGSSGREGLAFRVRFIPTTVGRFCRSRPAAAIASVHPHDRGAVLIQSDSRV